MKNTHEMTNMNSSFGAGVEKSFIDMENNRILLVAIWNYCAGDAENGGSICLGFERGGCAGEGREREKGAQ